MNDAHARGFREYFERRRWLQLLVAEYAARIDRYNFMVAEWQSELTRLAADEQSADATAAAPEDRVGG